MTEIDKASLLAEVEVAKTETFTFISLRDGITNVFYANKDDKAVVSRSKVDSPLLRKDLDRMYLFLRQYEAPFFDGVYYVMGHTDLYADIWNMPGFISVYHYSSKTRLLPEEVGKLVTLHTEKDMFKFILSPVFEPWLMAGKTGRQFLSNGTYSTFSVPCDVYPVIVTAKDSYGIYSLPKQHLSNIERWRCPNLKILKQNHIVLLECAATAEPT